MSELVSMQEGEGKLSLKLEDKKLKFEVMYDGKQADAGVFICLEVDEYLEMLKKAIPGDIDDMVIDGLKLMLLK